MNKYFFLLRKKLQSEQVFGLLLAEAVPSAVWDSLLRSGNKEGLLLLNPLLCCCFSVQCLLQTGHLVKRSERPLTASADLGPDPTQLSALGQTAPSLDLTFPCIRRAYCISAALAVQYGSRSPEMPLVRLRH